MILLHQGKEKIFLTKSKRQTLYCTHDVQNIQKYQQLWHCINLKHLMVGQILVHKALWNFCMTCSVSIISF